MNNLGTNSTFECYAGKAETATGRGYTLRRLGPLPEPTDSSTQSTTLSGEVRYLGIYRNFVPKSHNMIIKCFPSTLAETGQYCTKVDQCNFDILPQTKIMPK